MQQQELEQVLRSILLELRPYRSDIVLIGGWVPYLYRRYGGFSAWGGVDSLTFELDVLVPQPLAPEGRSTIAHLLREAGFRPQSGAGPAAVWVRDVALGEKIEFITPHQGTARGEGGFVPLREQPGVAAIPLTHLEVLADHTRLLALPPTRGMRAVEVRVPTLGAYVLNKALTFIRRGDRMDEGGAPKMAKDLVYLGDLMSPSGSVVRAITADIDTIAQSSPAGAERVRSAATNLEFVVNGHLRDRITACARMIIELETAESLAAVAARLRGHLLDLQEILTECAGRHAPVAPLQADFDGGA